MGRVMLSLIFTVAMFALTFAEENVLLYVPYTVRLQEVNVSIGVVSIAELSSKFPRAYNLLVKSHGVPPKHATHHLAVAVWKEENGKITYISNYKVAAEVRSPLLRAERKELTKYPHQYGDNYGGWFQMKEKGLYSINVYITDKSGKAHTVHFDYLLQEE